MARILIPSSYSSFGGYIEDNNFYCWTRIVDGFLCLDWGVWKAIEEEQIDLLIFHVVESDVSYRCSKENFARKKIPTTTTTWGISIDDLEE